MVGGYKEQYARTRRYFRRLTAISTGIPHSVDSQSYEDDLYAFFQNCYHFKDWIKNDPATNTWTDVENYITSNRYLRLCADLCNATKHLTLHTHRSTESPTFAGGDMHLNINDGLRGQEKIEIAINYRVSTQSGEIDALDIAGNCMNAWEAYLQSNNALV